MEKITVHNRIQMMIASKWKIAAKWILIVCGVILVVGALIALVMGDEINLFGEVVFPILLFIYVYRMNGTTRGYLSTPRSTEEIERECIGKLTSIAVRMSWDCSAAWAAGRSA